MILKSSQSETGTRDIPSAFLIQLAREKVHRKSSSDELAKLSLSEVQIINAFDGRHRLSLNSELSPFAGTLGCLISHLAIYLHCHRENIPRALIFEDDVTVFDTLVAQQSLLDGEFSNADICCYCSKSSENRFLNAHAYSMSLTAMGACLTHLKLIQKSPLNVHIDVLIESVRKKYSLPYRSLRKSTIFQNKHLPYTTRWGCLLYTSPSPRDATLSRMPSSA